jgi:hypothetical protein
MSVGPAGDDELELPYVLRRRELPEFPLQLVPPQMTGAISARSLHRVVDQATRSHDRMLPERDRTPETAQPSIGSRTTTGISRSVRSW